MNLSEILSSNISKQNFEEGLYIVPTPIGNLLDITIRGLAVLEKADVILCEDKRVTSKLLRSYALSKKIQNYNDLSNDEDREKILDLLSEQKIIALVSDAGTPLISDPGYKLVKEAINKGFNIVPLTGANAILPALCASGLPTDKFLFCGFLPNKQKALGRFFDNIEANITYVVYESPKRIYKTIKIFKEKYPDCEICVTKEISKLYEKHVRGKAADINIEEINDKGEFVISFYLPKTQVQVTDIQFEIERLLKNNSSSKVAKILSKDYNLERKEIYSYLNKIKNNIKS